ncbi:MAG: M1 family metallopeptidase [Bryobacteraceae bacterium]
MALACSAPALAAGQAADLARDIRENTFDPQECYRVRDLRLVKEDIRIYLTDGHLIFSKPVAGRRYAAIFTADVEGGDGEVILLPPDRAERSSLAAYLDSPNLDEHFRSVLLLFTGDDYAVLKAQMPAAGPANRNTPELGPGMAEQWNSVLRNVGASYQTRLTLDLLGSPGFDPGLLVGVFNSPKAGNFDLVYDPQSSEQIAAGQVTTRDNRLYFDTWASFVARSLRGERAPSARRLTLSDFRIESTLAPDLTLSCITRVKVKPMVDGITVAPFEIAGQMQISAATVDGRPAEVFEGESLRANLTRGGNHLFLVLPAEPLRSGREYEFEFHHSGKVIEDAGDRVFYVAARGNWYPTHGFQYATFDLLFRGPRDLDLVSAGDVVEDRLEGDLRVIRRRTSAPIRVAGFNLGNYKHARVERGGYVVDVCANRTLEQALLPRPTLLAPPAPLTVSRRRSTTVPDTSTAPPDPLARLESLALDVAAALEFMAARFGPPALPHITVSPIPGTFGQGFPGLLYLSTLSYLKNLTRATNVNETQEIFFADLLQAHEVAHQWWGNRVSAATYRDYWLMEALANYSALLFLEKTKGEHTADLMLDSYRSQLLATGASGKTVESAGPIVLGTRLENSIEPRAWREITYGKGTWIMQMLRRHMGDERFLSMLSAIPKRYDRQTISTEQFRELAAGFLPPKSDDPRLEAFFEQWVYGTGIPTLKLSYTVTGKAPALKLAGTLTQSGVDEDFTALAPVEIQLARGSTITRWVRSAAAPVAFTVPLTQVPLKVTLDPHRAVLRR